MWWQDDSYWGLDPFAEMRRLQRQMHRLVGACRGEGEGLPALNVWSSGNEVLVTAEIPGVDPNAIDIAVRGDQLTLRGERKAEETAEEVACHRLERGTGSFVRTLRLPFEVESDKVSAKYRNGVLRVTLPRAESSKPRRIAISGD